MRSLRFSVNVEREAHRRNVGRRHETEEHERASADWSISADRERERARGGERYVHTHDQSRWFPSTRRNMPVSLEQRLVAKPPSWNLTIDSTVVIVKGSMTIGSVMGQLVHRLGESTHPLVSNALTITSLFSTQTSRKISPITLSGGPRRIFG